VIGPRVWRDYPDLAMGINNVTVFISTVPALPLVIGGSGTPSPSSPGQRRKRHTV
jgi:hypothetical protein